LANAGVSLAVTGYGSLLSPLALGIVGGLFIGKQAGILGAVYLAKTFGVASLPTGASWRQVYGVAILCGIGFTMSLFIGLLAFADTEREGIVKLAVLVGSLLSALAGALVLATPAARTPAKVSQRLAP
jgi:NhaA family Na+:H+ antiporter